MSGPSVNFVTIIVLVATAGANVGPFFGVRDPLCAIMLVSAWMLPISRLKLRRRECESLPEGESRASQPRPLWFVILGATPWVALPALHSAFPGSLAWQSLDVPMPLRWIGMALAVGMFFAPFLRPANRTGDAMSLRAYTVIALAVVLISSNLFVAIVAAAGMVCLYRTSPRRGRVDVADELSERLAVAACRWEEPCETAS